MNHETLPAWVSVPLIILTSLTALYHCYILPGYNADKRKKTDK